MYLEVKLKREGGRMRERQRDRDRDRDRAHMSSTPQTGPSK